MNKGPVFIVGNSRSGTTMMSRILGNHPDIFTFNELHFFGQLFEPSQQVQLEQSQAIAMLCKLLAIQRNSYLTQGDSTVFLGEAQELAKGLAFPAPAPAIFLAFLEYEVGRHGKRIGCDQTPRNVYYLANILSYYPNARVINMIRDPRDVLLSQKNRWKRRFLSNQKEGIPMFRSLVTWSNYHPVTMGMLWQSGVAAADRFKEHPQVFHVRFEHLLGQPQESVQELCSFLDLPFFPEMLHVPQVGSSLEADRPERIGINASVAGRWQQGGLNHVEIALNEWATRTGREAHGYPPTSTFKNPFLWGYYLLTWLVKTPLALALNVRRHRNIFLALRKRLQR